MKISLKEAIQFTTSLFLAFLLSFSPILPSLKLDHFRLFGALTTKASYITWTGGGQDNKWTTPTNWSTGSVPGTSDIATFDSTSQKDIDINNDINVSGIEIHSDYQGSLKVTSSQQITVGINGFLQSGGSFTAGNTPITVIGSVNLNAGTFTAPSSTFTIKGNLAILSTIFSHNEGSVILDGIEQIVFGSATYNNFTKEAKVPQTLEFQSGSMLAFNGTLILKGNPGSPLALRASTVDEPFSINPHANVEVAYLDVKDSLNTSLHTINCDTCQDSGNNTGWNIPELSDFQTPNIAGLMDEAQQLATSAPSITITPDQEVKETTPPQTPPSPPSLTNLPNLEPTAYSLKPKADSLQPKAFAKVMPGGTAYNLQDKDNIDFAADEDIAFTLELNKSNKELLIEPIGATLTAQSVRTVNDGPDILESAGETPSVAVPAEALREGWEEADTITPKASNLQPIASPFQPIASPSPTAYSLQPTASPSPSIELPSQPDNESSIIDNVRNFLIPPVDAAENTAEAIEPVQPDNVITAKIFDPNGAEATITPKIVQQDGKTLITLPEPGNQLRPGKYQIEVTVKVDGQDVTATQDFTWGVLAMNFGQSTYQPNESVEVGMAVLDDFGRTICDATLQLDVIAPDGTVYSLQPEASSTCGPITVTETPDYSALFTPDQLGTYQVKLTADISNGTRTMNSSIEITNTAPYVVKRNTATRIYPPADYSVNITITANEDFSGTIYEEIPNNFILKEVSHDGDFLFTEAGQDGPADSKAFEQDILDALDEAAQTIEATKSPAPAEDNGQVASTTTDSLVPTASPTPTPYSLEPTSSPAPSPTPYSLEPIASSTPEIEQPEPTPTPDSLVPTASPTPTPYSLEPIASPSPSPSPNVAGTLDGINTDDLIDLLREIEDITGDSNEASETTEVAGNQTPPTENSLKYIVWQDIELTAGDALTLSYIYDAPDISPQFYLLGPLALMRSNDKLQNPNVNSNPKSKVQNPDDYTPGVSSPDDSPGVDTGKSLEIDELDNSLKIENWKLKIAWAEPRAWQLAADATFNDAADGNWNIGTTWGGACSSSCVEGTDYPGSSDTAVIDSHTITLTGAGTSTNMTIVTDGIVNTAGNDLTVSGNFVLEQEGTLIAQGDETISAIDTNNGTVMYNGTGEYDGLAVGDTYNNLTINNGLVGYWKFDDGTGTTVASDSSGYGNHGTDEGAAGANNTPQASANNTVSFNFSNPFTLDFDGSDDNVNLGSISGSNPLKLNNSQHTISAWVYKRSGGDSFQRIVDKSDYGSGTNGYAIWINSRQIGYSVDGNNWDTDDTTAINYSTWHHVVVVSNATSIIAYVDGIEKSGAYYSGSHTLPPNDNTNMRIGTWNHSTGREWGGLIDDVRIYDHALTEQEVNTLATGSISPTGSGKQVLDANLDVNGDLILNSGELDVSSSNYTVNVAGAWDNNEALFTKRSGTVTLDGTSGSHELQSGGQSFYNLTVNGSGGTWTLNDDLDVDNAYSHSNGTVDANNTDNWTVKANDFDQSGGTFTPRAGTVVVNSASNQTIEASSALYDFQAEDPTERGLVGYWKFDEGQGTTAVDSSGQGNDGTLTNSPKWKTTVTSTITYDNPYSLEFDGTDDYVSVEDSSTFDVLDGSSAVYSTSFWVNTTEAGEDVIGSVYTEGPTVLERRQQEGSIDVQFRFAIDDGNGVAWVIVEEGVSNTVLTSTSATNDGNWHHITAVRNGTAVTFYVDGTQEDSDISNEDPLSGYWLTLGRRVKDDDSGDDYFDGLIDDVRIYDRALSAWEVENLALGKYADGASSDSVYTLGAALDVNGSMYLQSGELDVSSSNYAITNALSWYGNGGGFNPRSGTVTLDGTSGTNTLRTGAQPFNNLTVSGSGGTWNLDDKLDVNGSYTQSNGTVDQLSYSMHVQDLDKTGGTLTTRDQPVVIDGTSNQTIESDTAINNLQIEDPTESNLVGYWKFDEGQGTVARDSTTNGNNGTLTNGPEWATTVTSTITYDNPYSLDFDGTDDYVDIGSITSQDVFSVSFWGKRNTVSDSYDVIFGTQADYAGLIVYENGNVSMLATSGGTGTTWSAVWTDKTEWHHIVYTQNGTGGGTTVELFFDGVSAGTNIRTGDALNAFRIGEFVTLFSERYYGGKLDDVRVYDTVLDSTAVQNLADGYYADGDSGTATFTLNAALDVDNDLTIQSGILDVSATPYNITLGNDWNNYSGTSGFTDQTGTVTLDGTSQTIRGTTTFYNLTDQETSSDTLTFATGKTQTIANTLDFDGADSNLLSLRSSVPSTRFTLDVTSEQTLTYVDVQDSNASTSDITCSTTTCTNSGNNDDGDSSPHWVFSSRGRVMIISMKPDSIIPKIKITPPKTTTLPKTVPGTDLGENVV